MANGDQTVTPEQPPVEAPSVSLVLTALNAEPNLREIVEEWIRVLGGSTKSFEIILVDDGSTDDTPAHADALALELPALRVLHHNEERGPGAAFASGLAEARLPLVCHAPCDKQFLPADLSRFLAEIEKADEATGFRKPDLATGYRVGQPVPLWLRIWDSLKGWMTRLLLGDFPPQRNAWLGWRGFSRRFIARWVFGLRVQDPECSFRLYRREIFRRIPIQSRGSLAAIEILAKANHLGCLIAEAPVSWSPPVKTDSDGASFGAEFVELFRRPDFGPAKLDEPPPPSDMKTSPPEISAC